MFFNAFLSRKYCRVRRIDYDPRSRSKSPIENQRSKKSVGSWIRNAPVRSGIVSMEVVSGFWGRGLEFLGFALGGRLRYFKLDCRSRIKAERRNEENKVGHHSASQAVAQSERQR